MILAVLQARSSSSRLPGKVLKPILGKPMLERQIERILRASMIDKLVVATSNDPGDDTIAELCARIKVECFRGSLDDVLDRFFQAARQHKPDLVVRLTGDCPLADPAVIDAVIRFAVDGKYDYASNTLQPTYPDGLDVEVCTFAKLEQVWRNAALKSQREHVMPYFYQNPHLFKLGNLIRQPDLSALRWTVDNADDFVLITSVFEALYPDNPAFGTDEVLAYLNTRPDLSKLNASHSRNEGYEKSLAEDAVVGAPKD
jgi:spore coat polysaccharide biosynthesis protein SpsF